MSNFLFRGVNLEFHKKFNGQLKPKDFCQFAKEFKWDEFEWDNFYWDENENNAVIEHQLHQAGYPTSGISTTSVLERAKYYATHDGKYDSGVIYVIDPSICESLGVKLYVVRNIVPSPSIPEDDEVILVAKDFGEVPKEVIVDIQYI